MDVRRWAPTLGQHNADILGEKLGLSDGEIAAATGILAETAPEPVAEDPAPAPEEVAETPAPEETPAAVAEVQPEATAEPEPVAETVAAEAPEAPEEDPKPKRRGWWSVGR